MFRLGSSIGRERSEDSQRGIIYNYIVTSLIKILDIFPIYLLDYYTIPSTVGFSRASACHERRQAGIHDGLGHNVSVLGTPMEAAGRSETIPDRLVRRDGARQGVL